MLRRLRRVCEHYGAHPTFCFASATIGNPGELASELCGLPVEQIDDDGSPRSERVLACWQRPLLDEHSGARASANVETAGAALALRARRPSDARVHAQPPRRGAGRAARAGGSSSSSPGSARVAAYRAGYLASERRELELELASGRLLGVAATNALELGIDVGGLDAVVLNGFPGNAGVDVAAGRARRAHRSARGRGARRRRRPARPVVRRAPGTSSPSRAPERAVVNPQNPFVLRAQVACAAHELPLSPDDDRWFGDGLDDAVRELVQADLLTPRGGRMYWSGPRRPRPASGCAADRRSSTSSSTREDERTIGTVDDARVFAVAHPGAVYLHQGQQYRVERLDLREHVAVLEPYDDDEYTQPRTETDIAIVADEQRAPVGGSIVHLGVGRGPQPRDRVPAQADLDEPRDRGVRARPPRARARDARVLVHRSAEAMERAGIAPGRLLGTVHAAEHGLIGMLPLFTICDRWDVGGVSMAQHPQTGEPTIFVYDGYPGGAGIAELAFDAAARHVRATLDLVAACPCDDGCPSCVQSPKCGNWNEYLDKGGAITLLGLMARAPVHG